MDDSSVKEVQDNGTGTEPTKIKSKSNTNLFDYTEEELLTDQSLTHYEILNIPEHATPDQVKKAYRKSSLKYHPDKTGRGENDYGTND